jgi:hypothetical protein
MSVSEKLYVPPWNSSLFVTPFSPLSYGLDMHDSAVEEHLLLPKGNTLAVEYGDGEKFFGCMTMRHLFIRSPGLSRATQYFLFQVVRVDCGTHYAFCRGG